MFSEAIPPKWRLQHVFISGQIQTILSGGSVGKVPKVIGEKFDFDWSIRYSLDNCWIKFQLSIQKRSLWKFGLPLATVSAISDVTVAGCFSVIKSAFVPQMYIAHDWNWRLIIHRYQAANTIRTWLFSLDISKIYLSQQLHIWSWRELDAADGFFTLLHHVSTTTEKVVIDLYVTTSHNFPTIPTFWDTIAINQGCGSHSGKDAIFLTCMYAAGWHTDTRLSHTT